MTVGDLRKSLNDLQKELLRHIADSYLAVQKGVLNRVVHSKYGKESVRNALGSLSGSVVYEVEDQEAVCSRYEPTFLGLLLAPNGKCFEDTLVRYVEYWESVYRADPEKNHTTSDELELHLSLTKDKSVQLYHVIIKGNLFGGSAGFSPAEQTWHVGIPRDVDDFPSWPDKINFLHQRAMQSYDPNAPVFLPERLHYSWRREQQFAGIGINIVAENAAVAQRDLHQHFHSYEKSPKTKVVMMPREGTISEEQGVEIKRLIIVLAEMEERVSGKSAFAKWYAAFNKKFRITKYEALQAERYEEAVSWLRRQSGILQRKLRQRDKPLWRNKKYVAIKTAMRELGMDKQRFYDLAHHRLGLNIPFTSLTELSDNDLERVLGLTRRLASDLSVHSKRGSSASPIKASQTKRFRVALSFPGEHRPFVSEVANVLATNLGKDRVFYDTFHEAELARPDLDVYLQSYITMNPN